jgi:hypothetical protein
VSFLRRLLGGGGEPAEPEPAGDPVDDEAAERAADLAVLRAEDERMDEFRRRQLRYARWSWQPPAQGGTRRADDGDPATEADRAAD